MLINSTRYRRAQAYPYEVEYFLADVINAAALHPKVCGHISELYMSYGTNIYR